MSVLSFLGYTKILVDFYDALPADLHQIFKGHHGVSHLQSAEHRVDTVCFVGQGEVVAHRRDLRVGGILLEVPHRDGHALCDLHQPIRQSRYFFFRQNAPRHTLRALFFCGKLFIVLLMLIGMGGGSLSKELYDWFGYTSSTATASAFVQQRNKIRSKAIEMIFNEFVASAMPTMTFRGYRLFAVDGSDLRLPSDTTNNFSLIRNNTFIFCILRE